MTEQPATLPTPPKREVIIENSRDESRGENAKNVKAVMKGVSGIWDQMSWEI